MNKELLIGFVFLVATAAVGFFTATVQNWNPFREEFVVYIDFNRINDLARNNDVTYAGLKVGHVKDILPIRINNQEKIRVTVSLQENVSIPQNSRITIPDRTILGGKKISITRPDDPRPPAKNGHIFIGVDPDPLIEEAGTTLKTIGESFEEVKSLLIDIKEGKGTMGKLFTDPELYNNYSRTGENLSEITDKINRGDGTLGKFVNESELYDDARTFVKKLVSTHIDLIGEARFFGEDSYSITNLGLKITTSPDKFYVAQAALLTKSHETAIATPRAIARQNDTLVYPTILIGRRFLNDNNLELALGAIEGEFGLASGFGLKFANENEIWLRLEARGRIRDKHIRENNDSFVGRTFFEYHKKIPHWPTLKISAGVHNFLDDTQGWIGFGFEYRDDDLKYLVGTLGGAS